MHRALSSIGVVLVGGALIAGSSLAQEIPDDEEVPSAPAEPVDPDVRPPTPRHIIIPDPFENLQKPQSGTPVPRARQGDRAPSVPPRITRDVPRPVRGDAPERIYGRYHVVEVTVAGVTEDFANKMERAGRALNEDCVVTRQIFDFGPAPADDTPGYRPREVEVVQFRECDVGGLGKYAEEVSMMLPAQWTEGDGSIALNLPPATVLADFVRVDVPKVGEMRMAPQWLAPEARVQRGKTSYAVIAESARRGALPVLHLTTSEQVYHLEADPADSSFDDAVRAMMDATP